ncbi:MAG: molybdopterin dinucleotide binding domain-containing protein [Candidatus Thorarchaeota archaeon]
MMSKQSIEVVVTSGRTLNQGRMMEKGKLTQEYEDAVSICELDTSAMETLGLKNGDPVAIQSKIGKTIVKSKLNKSLHPGIAFIPCGPWFNQLIGSDTQQTGMPSYKSVSVEITAAPEGSVIGIDELTRSYREAGK